MDGKLEAFPYEPRSPSAPHDLDEFPVRKVGPDFRLVAPQDRHVHVLVGPRDTTEEQVERPAAGDVPRTAKPAH